MSPSSFFLSWGMVISYAILNSLGALILKAYVNRLGPVSFDEPYSAVRYFGELLTSPGVLFGLLAIFSSAFVWIIALSRMDLSLAYPVGVGLNFLFVLTYACLIYQEQLTRNKLIGVTLILVSLYFLHREG